MTNLLLTLGGGIALIVIANLAVVLLTPMSARQAGVVVGIATAGAYLALIILDWPGLDIAAIQLAVFAVAAFVTTLVLDARARARAAGDRGTGLHWAPASIVTFFVLLIVVDSSFVLIAEHGLPPALTRALLPEPAVGVGGSTAFPGVVSHDFQEKEGLYNRYLDQLDAQAARGWQVQKGWLERPVFGRPAVFKVVARTRHGDPLPGAEVYGRFLRPSDSRLDTDFAMQELSPGVHQTVLDLPAPGMWQLLLHVRREGEVHEVRGVTTVAPD